jgi:uncharacterized membrane protein YdjX (TVP38/TMEM64 family)
MLPAMAFNYFVGSKLFFIVRDLVPKKRMYKIRRWVNRYGASMVFIFNLVPILPGSLLTFALGITRYDFTRLFMFLILGSSLKLLIVYWIFVVFA